MLRQDVLTGKQINTAEGGLSTSFLESKEHQLTPSQLLAAHQHSTKTKLPSQEIPSKLASMPPAHQKKNNHDDFGDGFQRAWTRWNEENPDADVPEKVVVGFGLLTWYFITSAFVDGWTQP
jgi:hypothetical protein